MSYICKYRQAMNMIMYIHIFIKYCRLLYLYAHMNVKVYLIKYVIISLQKIYITLSKFIMYK